jgi:aminoglycoside phosphotransferase (APT) family kinase protein
MHFDLLRRRPVLRIGCQPCAPSYGQTEANLCLIWSRCDIGWTVKLRLTVQGWMDLRDSCQRAPITPYAVRVSVMAHPGAEVLDWASAVLGSAATVQRGLRDGGSPWLLRVGDREVILRVAQGEWVAETATEVAAMTLASRVASATLPVAELLGYDLAERTEYGLVLTARVPGTSVIPPEPDAERLRALGAVAARISSIELTPTPALPFRRQPIEGSDFASMRREQGASDLLRAAEAAVAAHRPGDDQLALVHGDLWHGNTLWDDGKLTAVLDWDCAGVGPAGIDLGSLRCDAAWCHGLDAAGHVLDGWETEAARPAINVPYWDAVAALASPPDMGWFPTSMALQGRPDLTREVMLERRDAFLRAALGQLTTAG